MAEMLAESDAALLIGDPALRLAIAAEAKASPAATATGCAKAPRSACHNFKRFMSTMLFANGGR